MSTEKSKDVLELIPPPSQLQVWANALAAAMEEAPFGSLRATTLERRNAALQKLLKPLQQATGCPECQALLVHLGNRDLQLRKVETELQKCRHAVTDLDTVIAELDTARVPKVDTNGRPYTPAWRVKILARKTESVTNQGQKLSPS